MKLPVVSGREVIKALSKAGFYFVSQKGSHVNTVVVEHTTFVLRNVYYSEELIMEHGQRGAL